MSMPHDLVDLRLAPVALELDKALQELGAYNARSLAYQIMLVTNRSEPDLSGTDERQELLLRTVTQFIDLHGWTVTWDPRGVRLRHGDHTMVLGVSRSIRRFVEGVRP